jgi:hypothetical protein
MVTQEEGLQAELISELLKTLKFVSQTVHQAHHEGPIGECKKATCRAAVVALAKAAEGGW